MNTRHRPPVVLIVAGNDPSGGAGLCADIESVISHGCHPAPVVSCLTVQDTRDVADIYPVSGDQLLAQARPILADLDVAAVKLGLLPTVELVAAAQQLLQQLPGIPVVCDPVLASGGSGKPLGRATAAAILEHLVPATSVLTPNLPELEQLAPQAQSVDAAATALIARGCELVLVTGTHDRTEQVCNRLYRRGQGPEHFLWPRLNDTFHGSGCTLATSVAALLARGIDPLAAVHRAQGYTWQALAKGHRLGAGQCLPDRLFWVHEEPAESG